jgi:hypothetical protein
MITDIQLQKLQEDINGKSIFKWIHPQTQHHALKLLEYIKNRQQLTPLSREATDVIREYDHCVNEKIKYADYNTQIEELQNTCKKKWKR